MTSACHTHTFRIGGFNWCSEFLPRLRDMVSILSPSHDFLEINCTLKADGCDKIYLLSNGKIRPIRLLGTIRQHEQRLVISRT